MSVIDIRLADVARNPLAQVTAELEQLKTDAEAAAGAASGSAGTATTQAGIATTKAGEAATSASNAATSETNAGNSAGAASDSAIAAAAGAAVVGDAVAVLAARDKAEAWAEEDEDVEVETAQYSAKHHKLKALAAELAAELAQSAAEAAQGATELAAQAVGVYADTTLAAAVTAGLAGTAEGDTFWATGEDVDSIVLYRHDAGPAATEILRLTRGDPIDTTYTALSGYAFAIVDQDDHIAFGIDPDGEITTPATPRLNAIQDEPTLLSDVLWGVTDQDGRFGFGIKKSNGHLLHKNVEIDLSRFAELSRALDTVPPIDCWGDSLVQGNSTGVTVTFPTALAALIPDRTVNNRGLSGQTSNQVSTRSGSKPSILTVASNTIPASGAVSVTVTENGNFGSKSDLGARVYLGTLFGIHGKLTVSYNAVDGNLAGTSTFTRTEPGVATLIPDRTPFIRDTETWENDLPIIWVGRNDIISAYADPGGFSNAAIIANIDLMLDFLVWPLRKQFLILGVTDAVVEYAAAGGLEATAFAQILDLNYQLTVKYPRNFLDIRKILVNSYDSGDGADVTAFGRNQVPPSLQGDGLHLNDAGYAIVAQSVFTFLTKKGWLS